ncbi:unnamed protein product [Paramecium sonneborni]|uniref:Uncharacterized protein n=1 Tax=Paramecium sonneborni TaxID=65129 RepID=A0A8S1KBM8_9CILI|nr:unnamed protein product [Paramecium sonneborni]
MKQQFLQIQLNDSQQEASQINLYNMVEMLKDPDFRQKFQQCKYDYELIEIFPLVGFGITITKTKKNSETKIKVTDFSKVLKIIDLSALDLKNVQKKNQSANCILPLLSKDEENDQLLNCELFKRKISYLVHEKLDSYKEDTYLLLIQASIHYIIEKEGIQSWGKEILQLAFQTCQQIFINSPLFCKSISMLDFEKSKFKLLNLFCLFQMEQVSIQEIFDYYVCQNVKQKIYDKLDEDQLQNFFDKLKFECVDQIYENITQFMEDYLEKNNYFLLKLTQKKILQGIIEYMIPKELQWLNLQKLEYIQSKYQDIKTLKYYTISTIFQKLVENLVEKYSDEKKFKYFQSFSQQFQEYDDQQSYQEFLMKNHKYHDILEIYELYNQVLNECQNDNFRFEEKYQIITIRFIINKISIESIKRDNPNSFQELEGLIEFKKVYDYLEIFKKIYNINEEFAKNIHVQIVGEIKNLIWLNYLSSVTDFKENEMIKQFIKNFLSHLTNWKSILEQEVFAKYLVEISRFTFLLILRTRKLKQIEKFNQQQLQNIMTKDKQKEPYCTKIFEISKTFK